MTLLLFLSTTVAMILILWFRTEVYVEYCKHLNWNYICDYEDYEKKKEEEDVQLNYLGYLRQYHNNFFIRLITCPICLSVWISLLLCIFTASIQHFPPVMIIGLTIYLVIDKLIG